jgi:integrase
MSARAKRGRGEGSIFERADGRWVVSISLGYDARGKRRRKKLTFKTKLDARAALARLQGQVSIGQSIEPSRILLAPFAEDWLEKNVKNRVRPATLKLYSIMMRVHVLPKLGGMRISAIKPAHVQALQAELLTALHPSSARIAHSVLSMVLDAAVKWGYIPTNAAKLVDLPSIPKTLPGVWTPAQAVTFLDRTAGHRLHPLYVLALSTGMRRGELLGLRWEDVDYAGARLRVRASKTAAGIRTIDLPPVAIAALRVHAERMREEGLGAAELVFCDTSGRAMKGAALLRRFREHIAEAGLPVIGIHGLRHTSATMLLLANVSAKVVQERLGHANITMTLGRYSHVLPSMQREAAGALQALLGSPPGSQSVARRGDAQEHGETGGPALPRKSERKRTRAAPRTPRERHRI